MRIVYLEHDMGEESQYEGPFQIGEAFTKIEVHLSHSTLANTENAPLPEIGLPPQINKVLDFKEREIHDILIDHINKGENGPNNWLG